MAAHNGILHTDEMKKGAIFDLDGTLVDTSRLHEKAWVELFGRHGISLDPQELKEQRGKKNTLFIRLIMDRKNRNDVHPDRLSDEKDHIVLEILKTEPVVLFDGVKTFLALLKKNNVKMALATTATKQTGKQLSKEIGSFFDTKIFAEDVNQGKPHPEIFLKAARQLGLKKEECIVFEDAQSGIEAARAGGFFCIAKGGNLGQDRTKADVVIQNYNPSELITYFLSAE